MVIFNSYVKLPEGRWNDHHFHEFPASLAGKMAKMPAGGPPMEGGYGSHSWLVVGTPETDPKKFPFD